MNQQSNMKLMREPRRWLSDDEQKMWRAWLDAQFRLRKILNDDLEKDAGFDHLTYEIFVNLSESESHSLRMAELARRVSTRRSCLTYRIKQLEKQGYVKRHQVQEDGRGLSCLLTEKGYLALVEAAPSHVDAVLEYFIETINPKDIKCLTEVFSAIARNHEE